MTSTLRLSESEERERGVRESGPTWSAALLAERIFDSARCFSLPSKKIQLRASGTASFLNPTRPDERYFDILFICTQIPFIYFISSLERVMPSINMKLEMLTLIACEVDTEVFTSDKMQVWFHNIACFPLLHSCWFCVCCLLSALLPAAYSSCFMRLVRSSAADFSQ